MAIICDTSLLIAAEKNQFDLTSFFLTHPNEEFMIAAITASELLHGVQRAADAKRKAARRAFVEGVLKQFAVVPFQLEQARYHARLWVHLETKGMMIGPHD